MNAAFKDPNWLWLLLPTALFLIRAYILARSNKLGARFVVPSQKAFANSYHRLALSRRFWPRVLIALGLVFCIIALARPRHSYQKVRRNVEGIDIMMVLDLSASMRVEDFRDRNRLDTAKPIIRDFIKARLNDKIGFQVFSGEAVTLVPPTLDHGLVLQALDGAQLGDLKDGTAIGDALATAVARLKDSRAKSRVIVLLTDGDSNVGVVDPLTAGELAHGYGIKVYSIAIGRDGQVAIPMVTKDFFGRTVKTYQQFDSSINPELLKQISARTSGKFYRVQDDVKVLRDVFADINQLERTKIETVETTKYDERYQWPLLIGLLFLALAYFGHLTVFRVFP